jgi:hypothetical protein
MDGSSNIERNNTGIVLISLKGQIFEYGVYFEFLDTNNVSRSKALQWV